MDAIRDCQFFQRERNRTADLSRSEGEIITIGVHQISKSVGERNSGDPKNDAIEQKTT